MAESIASSCPSHLPEEIWAEECRLVHLRRTGETPSADASPPGGVVGLALSGGGIRSATTSLGVLQALARLGLLPSIDYVSTVSGGGYAGTFLGGVYQRWRRPGEPQPERRSAGPAAGPSAPVPRAAEWERVKGALLDRDHPVDWLRENGRYLAPNGAGDVSAAAAVVLRNLVAVQVVLATALVALLLTVNGLRRLGTLAVAGLTGVAHPGRVLEGLAFWWSPAFHLAALLLVSYVLPLGVAYWLVPADRRRAGGEHAALGAVWLMTAVGGAAAWTFGGEAVVGLRAGAAWDAVRPVLWRAAAGGCLTLACLVTLLVTRWSGRYEATAQSGRDPGAPEERSPARTSSFRERARSSAEARNFLTLRLRTALVIVVALALFACVDTLGQTIFVVTQAGGVGPWLTALGGTVVGGALVTGALTLQRFAGVLGSRTEARPPLPGAVVAGVAAAALILGVLVGTSALAHALSWEAAEKGTADDAPPQYVVTQPGGGEWRVTPPPARGLARCGPPEDRHLCAPAGLATPRYGIALGLAWILTLLLGRSYAFVNGSSLSSMYGARLTRAYLGASNVKRTRPELQALSVQVDDDDLTLGEYRPHERGGPLHLINVTLNETFGGRSQVEQRDRKGMGMAIGPAGVSVGARHHAIFAGAPGCAFEALRPTKDPAQGFRVFPSTKALVTPVWPTLGQWMAISGAAVSTGLGSRTSLALSLLLGTLNLRLGHWWRSGVDPARPLWASPPGPAGGGPEAAPGDQTSQVRQGSSPPSTLARFLGWAARFFPVQAHLINEIVARFPGTSGPDWYLTDGGHFENTGAYELIRRQLPTILLCDNGEDAGRFFDDLANLVRKARVDFDAEVEFLDHAQLDRLFPGAERSGRRRVFGTLRDLGCAQCAPGAGGREHAARQGDRSSPIEPCRYAALARVTYRGSAQVSALIVLRPSVLGTEPADVLSYRARNPTFPQQDTGDQFFDEAQWESYRRLGECMAMTVLGELMEPGLQVASGWQPISQADLRDAVPFP